MKDQVVVIGAGVMGLTTAYYLSKSGYSVTVLEASDRVGGMAQTFTLENGSNADKFYHYFCHGDHHLFKLLGELNLKEDLLFTKQNTGLIYLRPQFDEICISDFNGVLDLLALKELTATDKFRFILHSCIAKYKDITAKDDLDTAIENIVKIEGSHCYDFLWESLFQKKFYQYKTIISKAWLNARLKRAFTSKGVCSKSKYGIMRNGIDSIFKELRQNITNFGGKVICNSKVTEIKNLNHKVKNINFLYNGFPSNIQAKYVISTIPLPYLPTIIKGLSHEEYNRLSSVKNIGCITVVFNLKEPLSKYFWTNANMPNWPCPGIVEFSHFPYQQGNLVYFPLYVPHDHALWSSSDEKLVSLCLGCMNDVNDTEITEYRVFRYEFAQPIFDVGFNKLISTYKTSIPNLFCADTSFSYPNDRCMNESIRIAKELSDLVISQKNK